VTGAAEALFLLGLVGSFTGVGYVTYRWFKSRRDGRALLALKRFAAEHGWTYREYDGELARRFLDKPMTVCDVVTGTYRHRSFWCFEEPPDESRGDAWHCRRYFAVATPSSTPMLEVTRRELAGGRPDSGELDLADSDLYFSHRVTTDDEAFARAVLDSLAPSGLLRNAPLRFTGDAAVTWQDGRLTAPSVEPALTYLCDVLDRLEPLTTGS
jgi:hypothetical protein